MIDMRKLKELIRLMTSNELLELDLRDKDEQVTIRRPNIHSAPQILMRPPVLPRWRWRRLLILWRPLRLHLLAPPSPPL